MDHEKNLSRLNRLTKEISLLTHTFSVLGWDQETYMPENAAAERSEQSSLISRLIHQRASSSEMEQVLSDLGCSESTPDGDKSLPDHSRRLLRRAYKSYKDAVKLPEELVSELAEHSSISQINWAKAKNRNDFSLFRPYLEKMIDLLIRKSEILGYESHRYDALLDQFEPWTRTTEIKSVFNRLQPELTGLLNKISGCKQVDDSILHRKWDIKRQKELSHFILKEMNFDFTMGRIDESEHPFTATLGGSDIRLTTRYDKHYFNMGLYGTMHEGGHGLYEQGIPGQMRGTALGECASLAIHESQSRLWENMIGRSMEFFTAYYGKIAEIFPEPAGGYSAEEMFKAVNMVKPSLIRVEADEVTYGLHIILRFRLELQLLEGSVAVKDLPEAWNELSRELLGIVPDCDAAGVLQDVHWSFGGVGYFPTYTLGNLYSAQFLNSMNKDLDVSKQISSGKLLPVLNWLRENIHGRGALYSGPELCRLVTGEDLNPDYFMNYLNDKYDRIYNFNR
ncbi:MAG: carboxypeptidase M32 [Spirochaetes bacterium]|nr:carboxypeptidase M32 [Spirochaetota bacterium]